MKRSAAVLPFRHAFKKKRLAAVLLAFSLTLCLLMPLAVPALADSLGGYVWMEYAGNPVFSGINRAYYPCVIKVGATYHMWYTDVTGSGAYQVGHATSADGIVWSAPAMVTGIAGGQPGHTIVVNVGTEVSPSYRMWYGDGATWPFSSDCIRTAVSSDGLAWSSDVVIGEDPSAGLMRTDDTSDPAYEWRYGTYGPAAVLYNPSGYSSLNTSDPMGNRYVMYYNQYTRYWLTGVQESTGLAISADGVNWSRYGNGPVLNASGGSTIWDGQYAYAWSVIKHSTDYHMWYSGGITAGNQGIGYAYSSDGLNWTKEPNSIMHISDPAVPAWRASRTYTPSVLQEGSIYKMWFTGVGSSIYSVGYAVAARPDGAPTDPTGSVKRSYYYREDVYCSGSGFFPNSSVDVYIVPENDWTNGMTIGSDVSSDGVNTASADAVGNLSNTLVWLGPLTIGDYDIVFDADQDGVYDSPGDYVDNPHDPGFSVYGDPQPAPAFPTIYAGIAAALVAGALAYLVRARVAKKALPYS